MTSKPHAYLSAGHCVPPYPYRGREGGTSTQCADVPDVPNTIGRSAYVIKSTGCGVCHWVDVPPTFDVPPHRTTTKGRHIKKQPVSRARAGYQKANEQAARIIAGDPLRYPGLPQTWARLVLAKAAPSDAECGPLFRAA